KQETPSLRKGERVVSRDDVFVNDDGVAVAATRLLVADASDEWVVLIDGSGAERRRTPFGFAIDRHVSLFLANPVTELNDPSLLDQNDAAAAVPAAAYRDALLRDLNDSGPLAGPNVMLVDLQEPHIVPVGVEAPLVVD